MTTAEVVDAKKTRIADDEAWTMLQAAESVTIAKGKKYQTFNPATDDKAAILKQAMGPSGNLRAPTYRVKNRFVIGFNAELYEDWVK